ncbi:MAG: DUF4388 domain-containing protein, partial [Planctomycetota bacterium]
IFQPHGITLVVAGDRKSKEIGKLLVYHRHLTLSQLNEALSSQKKSKPKAIFGKTLIDMGLVTREHINRIMLDQIKEEIYDLFTWEKANFEFIEDPKEVEKLDLDPNLFIDKENISGTILEAMQRIDEWKLIREEVASLNTIYVPGNLSMEEIANLRSEEALKHILNSEPAENSANLQIFSLLDGRNTVEDIVQKSYMPRFEVFVEICNLLRQGFIRSALPFEVLTLCQSMMDKVKKAQIYAAIYPQCSTDPQQVSCTLEILKYFQENPSFRAQFPADLKKAILKMAEMYIQGKDLESARFLLRVSLPQFSMEEDYLKVYLDILAKLQESEEALGLIFPIAKRFSEQGEFRKFGQYYNLAKQFNTNHPLFKKIQALRTSPEKKRKLLLFVGIVFVVVLLFGGYYYFYHQSQQNALALKETIQKELKTVPLHYQKQIELFLKEENYTEAMALYQESIKLQAHLEGTRQELLDFLLKNSLFFVQTSLQETNTELDQIRFTLKTQIMNIQTKFNTMRGEIFKQLNTILLDEGSLSLCFQKLQQAEPLLKAAIKYHISYNDLNSKPEFDNNYYSEGELLSDEIKGSVRVFFDTLSASIEIHKIAKSKLEDAQQLWNKGISLKNYLSFQSCLSLYKELYKLSDTDFHRQSQVPLLILPTFEEEFEPELTKMKEFPPQLKIKLENAQFEQMITLEEKNSFLCSYPLPIKKNPEKPNILLEMTYPGFKSIQEKIFPTDLQISYPCHLRRKHIEFPQYSNVLYLIPYPEKQYLILVHAKEGASHLIRAITLEGQEIWKFFFTGTLNFAPILYKDLFFVGATTDLSQETAKANCVLYDLATPTNVSPREINTIQVEGGIRSSPCFFPEQQLLCFSSITKASNKTVGCLRFHSMEDLSETFPSVTLSRIMTTGIAHDNKDNLYFGSGNTFFSYSLNDKKFLWKQTRKTTGATEDNSNHLFIPFVSEKEILVPLNTASNNGYLMNYDQEQGKSAPSSLNNAVNFPPQLYSGFIAITTTYEVLTIQLNKLTLLSTYFSSIKILSSAISNGKYTYFFNDAGEVLSVNLKGEVVWKYPIKKISKDTISKLSGQPCILTNYLIFPFKNTLVLFELMKENE